jgi:hypothetical protein
MIALTPNHVLPVDVRQLSNGDWIAEVAPTIYGIGRSKAAALADLGREINPYLAKKTPRYHDQLCNH